VKTFDAGKTRMIGLPYGEKNGDDNVKPPFSSDTGTSRTDIRTDRIAISISRVSMLSRDKIVNIYRLNEHNTKFGEHIHNGCMEMTA